MTGAAAVQAPAVRQARWAGSLRLCWVNGGNSRLGRVLFRSELDGRSVRPCSEVREGGDGFQCAGPAWALRVGE